MIECSSVASKFSLSNQFVNAPNPLSGKPTLLVISQQWSWPFPNGFTVRAIELLKQLARRWNIVLAAPAPADERKTPEPVELLERITLPSSLHPGDGLPTATLESQVNATRDVIDRLHPEAIVCWGGYGFRIVEALEQMPHPPIICDFIDCWSLTHWREIGATWNITHLLRKVRDITLSAIWERRIARRVAAVLTVGERDARVLRALSGTNTIHVVPNGAPLHPLRSETDLDPTPTIIFTGVMEYGPNIDAALFFAQEVFPLIRKESPSAVFVIAGRRPTPDILALRHLPGIEVCADVPDMFTLLKKAWIAVAPMRQGAGIKNKVLEAWAVGLPVVMTPVGSNGLNVPPGGEALVGESAEELAKISLSLLKDTAQIHSMGSLCWNHVRENQSWDRVGDDLFGIVDGVISR